MDSLQNKIRHQIENSERGSLFFPNDFNGQGSSEAIRATLSRLCKEGLILRAAHGVYYFPKIDKWNGEPLRPSLEEIAYGIAKRDKARIVPVGAYALNALGLSTQVPANAVFITDGPQRKVSVGEGKGIWFKHSTEMRMFAFQSALMQLIVTAMREIGEGNVTDEQLAILKQHLNKLTDEEQKKDLLLAPVWINKLLTA